MTALVLSGGGARGAYQVGVVQAVIEICAIEQNPFRVIAGTSAGGINAAFLAANAHDMGPGIERLKQAWCSLQPNDVYKTSWFTVLKKLLRIGGRASHLVKSSGFSVLDNEPLGELLTQWINFKSLNQNLKDQVLQNLAITAMDYQNGTSISFFQGHDVEPWKRAHRRGVSTRITLDHILASSAIPVLFPPQMIEGRYYGDGAIRQLHPLSSAVRLGAKHLFVVGVSANDKNGHDHSPLRPPSIAQVAGHLLNREFIDNLEADIEMAKRFNLLIDDLSPEERAKHKLEKISIEVVAPSIAIDDLAVDYIKRQPRSMRFLFRLIGAEAPGAGASFASYLMFDGAFCRELIEAGYKDAWDQADSIRAFFASATPFNSEDC